MVSVALITNPASHTVQRKGSVLEPLASLSDGVAFYRIDDFSKLPAAFHDMLQSGISSCFVEGGDGTLQAVLSAYLQLPQHSRPPLAFALLPGGSTNLAYNIMGLKNTHASAIRSLILKLSNGGIPDGVNSHKAILVDISGRTERLAGFVLSTGSLARAMIYTQENLHKEKRREWRSVARAVWRLAILPDKATLEDGGPVITPSNFEAIDTPNKPIKSVRAFSLFTTLPSLSLNLKPFWNIGDHPIAHTYATWPIKRLKAGVMKLMLGKTGASMARHGLSSEGIEKISFRTDGNIILDGEHVNVTSDETINLSASAELRFIRA